MSNSTTHESALVLSDASSTALSSSQHITFRFIVPEYVTAPGEQLKIVGSLPELGAWDLNAAPSMNWHEGHRWVLEMSLPKTTYEFKVVMTAGHTLRWEQGVNRIIQTDESVADVAVELVINLTCHFNHTAATIMDLVLPKGRVEESYELAKATLELLQKRRSRLRKAVDELRALRERGGFSSPSPEGADSKMAEVARLDAAVANQASSVQDLSALWESARKAPDGTLTVPLHGKVEIPSGASCVFRAPFVNSTPASTPALLLEMPQSDSEAAAMDTSPLPEESVEVSTATAASEVPAMKALQSSVTDDTHHEISALVAEVAISTDQAGVLPAEEPAEGLAPSIAAPVQDGIAENIVPASSTSWDFDASDFLAGPQEPGTSMPPVDEEFAQGAPDAPDGLLSSPEPPSENTLTPLMPASELPEAIETQVPGFEGYAAPEGAPPSHGDVEPSPTLGDAGSVQTIPQEGDASTFSSSGGFTATIKAEEQWPAVDVAAADESAVISFEAPMAEEATAEAPGTAMPVAEKEDATVMPMAEEAMSTSEQAIEAMNAATSAKDEVKNTAEAVALAQEASSPAEAAISAVIEKDVGAAEVHDVVTPEAGEVETVMPATEEAAEAVVPTAEEAALAVVSEAEAVVSEAEAVIPAAEEAAEAVVSAAEESAQVVMPAAEEAAQAVVSEAEAVIPAAEEATEAVMPTAEEAAQAVVSEAEAVIPAAEEAAEAVVSEAEAVIPAAEEAAEAVVSAAEESAQVVMPAADEAAQAVVSEAEAVIPAAEEAAEAVVLAAVDAAEAGKDTAGAHATLARGAGNLAATDEPGVLPSVSAAEAGAGMGETHDVLLAGHVVLSEQAEVSKLASTPGSNGATVNQFSAAAEPGRKQGMDATQAAVSLSAAIWAAAFAAAASQAASNASSLKSPSHAPAESQSGAAATTPSSTTTPPAAPVDVSVQSSSVHTTNGNGNYVAPSESPGTAHQPKPRNILGSFFKSLFGIPV